MTMSKHVDCAAKGRLTKLDAFVRRMKGGSSAQSAVEFAFALPSCIDAAGCGNSVRDYR